MVGACAPLIGLFFVQKPMSLMSDGIGHLAFAGAAAGLPPQARDEIAKGGSFEASVAQDFTGIGRTTADTVARVLAGEVLKASVIYVPTKLITSANAAE